MLAAGALVVILGCGGCSAPPPLPQNATPEAVARRYFELLADGHDRAARELIWRPHRYDGVVPETGYRGLTGLRVGASRPDTATNRPDEYRDLAELRLLRAEYVRHRTDSVGSAPGADGRFVLLGREGPDAPWLVIEVGTGP